MFKQSTSCQATYRKQQLAETRSLMGPILSERSCYTTTKNLWPCLFSMIHSVGPQSHSFSTAQREQRECCSWYVECSEVNVNMCSSSKLCLLWVYAPFYTDKWWFNISWPPENVRFFSIVSFPPIENFIRLVSQATSTHSVSSHLLASAPKTWLILFVKKFHGMINKNSSTENLLIQLWMDPSGE